MLSRFAGAPGRRAGIDHQSIHRFTVRWSMVNARVIAGKHIGPRDSTFASTPAPGILISTDGWGIPDFLNLCEAAGFLGVPDFNINETPQACRFLCNTSTVQ